MNLFKEVGKYVLFLKEIFQKTEKRSVYYQLTIKEIYNLGLQSLPFVAFVSIFVGAVVTLQTEANTGNSWTPRYIIGFATRDSIVLEFSPTIISLLLAGKVGSYIASGIGTMRVTEQIDALEIMGVNSAGFLTLPKMIALVFFNPVLIMVSIVIGIYGGYLAGTLTGACTSEEFIMGLQVEFPLMKIIYSLSKTIVFAFFIATVPAFYGYYTTGGALGIGKASTKAVVYTSVIIIILNLILTDILLS